MKILLIISFSIACFSSYAQMELNDVEDKKIAERIQFAKAKTDSFLLDSFKKKEKSKFRFEFSKSSYYPGDSGFSYRFFNYYKPDPGKKYSLTHHYSFFDKEINLYTEIDVYCNGGDKIQPEFQTLSDSLKYSGMIKIYNKGFLKKIKAKAAKVKFDQPYTVIRADKENKAFDIILMDKVKPHNYFIK